MPRHLRSSLAILEEGALALHHLQTGVEFVAALGAAHTVALDRPLFAGHSHATAVRTASYLGGLAIQRLELRPAKTVHVLSVKLPGLPCVVHDGQGDVMVSGVVLQFLARLEPADDQLFALRSEEHTSELQSPCNLVCRLLLEKKKL